MEAGCRRYGCVRYDSYFSHWNRIDLLNSWKHDDDIFANDVLADDEILLPHTYDTGDVIKEAKKNNYCNNYDHSAYRNKNKVEDSNTKNNFYKCLGPAHKEEKALEEYINNQSTASTLKLQVKVIIEKSEKLKSHFIKKENTDLLKNISNDSLGKNQKNDGEENDVDNGIENVIKTNEIGALEDLIHSVSDCGEVAVSARNIKLQENNDDRQYSLSFISLPTLNATSLTLEAVSVILVEKNEIRSEAWKQLQIIKLRNGIKFN